MLLTLKRALRLVAYTVEQRAMRLATLPHPPRRYTREARLLTGRLGLSKSKERLDMPHAFQERYSAHGERFAALRQRYYLIACAWCQKPIRWKRKETASPCEVSHGICAHCFAHVSQEAQDAREPTPACRA